jgi:predicted phage terminase large subunit-like protein
MTDEEIRELEQILARERHLEFMRHCWIKGSLDPFMVGFHTRKICEAIDNAMEKFANGISSFLLVSVHPRAGKSDIVSRYLGPHFLGEFPDKEVMQVTYAATLAASFSTFSRNILRSEKYRQLYPHIFLSSETNQKANLAIADYKDRPTGGRIYAAGLQSGLTGNGFHLGILDDYFSGRAEAESLIQRNNAWDAFVNDFMTRKAPVSIVIVLATQWHIDDINGRIKKQMKIDPNFPQFDVLSFPAKAEHYKGDGKYPNKYLFMERFDETYYLQQYALLGPYSSAALLDCDPTVRTGGRFNLDTIDYYDTNFGPFDKKWVRVWDLAHTAAQRKGDDPDYTAGSKICFEYVPGDVVPHLWIDHVFRTRDNAGERDPKIKAIADMDGPYIAQYIENSLDSKDAYQYIKNAMPEISWNELICNGDKGARATPLETIFLAPGHVHIKRADWNNDLISELMAFDGTGKAHDDQVDNISAAYQVQIGDASIMDEKLQEQMAARRRA